MLGRHLRFRRTCKKKNLNFALTWFFRRSDTLISISFTLFFSSIFKPFIFLHASIHPSKHQSPHPVPMALLGKLASHTSQKNVGVNVHHDTIISSLWLIQLPYLNYANAAVPNWSELPSSGSFQIPLINLCSLLGSVCGGLRGGGVEKGLDRPIAH